MKKIDFLGYRYIAYTLSIVSFIATIILAITPGIQYGVDFKGGTELQLKFTKPVDDEIIRKVLKDECKLNYVVVQSALTTTDTSSASSKEKLASGQSLEKLIKTDFLAEKPMIDPETKKEVKTLKEVKEKITAALQAKDKDLKIDSVSRETSVGPSVGKELRSQAVIAVMIALIGILAYVTFQFEFKFALPSIIALFHDVIITLGFIILTGKEMDMIQLTVLLTVVGYSINDTIIICDRVRENYRIMKKVKYYDLVNESLAQVFSRTVITVLTTELPLIAMYFFGGEVLSAFASSMIFGTVIGCFSSIYVVSPMIVAWKEYEEKAVA